jgi:hypothetical protein
MIMTIGRFWAGMCATFIFAACTMAAEEQPRFRLHCQVFRIAGVAPQDVQLAEPIWAGKQDAWDKVKDSIVLFTRAAFKFGNDTLSVNEKTVSWNKERLNFDGKDKVSGVTGGLIKLIYFADVDLQRGKTGSVFIAAKQPFEYFERRDDGLYELKEIELPAGLDLEVKPKEQDDKSILLSNVTIRLRSVTERETIPGVDLRVGRPVLQTEEFKLSLRVKEKGIYWIQVKPRNGDGSMLISLEAQYI